MPRIFRSETNRVFDREGRLLSQEDVQVDITEETIRQRALQALTTNAAYLAIPAPTAAEVRTQTELLTKEVNGLIRLLLNQFDDISDT